MIFVRDKGQMCNNILQYAHVYAWARENNRHSMSMRFAYKYQYFNICSSKNHNFTMYVLGKYGAKYKILPVVTYDLGEEGKAEKERFTLNHKNVIIEGWGVRYYDLFLKYKQEILDLFEFKREIRNKISKLLANTSDEDTIKIGVHIRRGDYQTFFNGIYFFYDYAFLYYIKSTMEMFPGRKFSVYVCGNDPNLDKDYYIRNLPDAKVVFPDGNPGEDLCILSECDFLLGPPSSYSLVATMYGKARLHWMTCDKAEITMDSFKDFDTLFRTFDDYWIDPPKPRKKILFLISRFLDGGIDTVMVEYINNLCNLTNHQLSLGIMLKMPEFEVFTHRLPENINLKYLVEGRWLTWYKRRSLSNKKSSLSIADEIFINPLRRLMTQIKIWKLVKQHDVIIDFDSTFGAFIPTKMPDKKKISFFHFSFEKELDRDTRHMKRRIMHMRNYDHIVTLSNAMFLEATKMFPELRGKLVRIYNSINLHRILVQVKEPVNDPRINDYYILAVERLEETQKDISTLVDTYALLKERYTGRMPKLYIIGEGNSRQTIEQHILQHGLKDDIILLGFIANPFPWMANAEAIVHSSKFEGLPTVLIEALMLDKPIVASDCPTGPREILKNGKAGMLVPVGDTEAFAEAIMRILSDNELRGNLKREIKKHKKVFLAEKNISTLEQLF